MTVLGAIVLTEVLIFQTLQQLIYVGVGRAVLRQDQFRRRFRFLPP